MKTRHHLFSALGMSLLLTLAARGLAQTDASKVDPKSVADPAEGGTAPAKATDAAGKQKSKAYSPYAGRKFPTRVFFGDTHHHTANSGDAFMAGNRLTPEQSYRFARGEEVTSSGGLQLKLGRPLDFLVVSDHAEGLGVMFQVYDGVPEFMADETLARWNKMMKSSQEEGYKAAIEVQRALGSNTLPPPMKDPKIMGPIIKSVWQKYTETAEKFNAPGQFTAMIGYEWTSVPGGNNLHRNILWREGKAVADQIGVPFSAMQSEDPEKLWEWMEKMEQKTGAHLLAIPHNGNISGGRMFELVDFTGKPLTREYAERRARWEVLMELIQTKGNSETHPALSPNDEFADYGVTGWDTGNLTLEVKTTPEMRPHMYARSGLLLGLAQEEKLGANPFKFGFIGSTDVHNSLTAVEEDNYFAKFPSQEPGPHRWDHISKEYNGITRYSWHYMAAGYAAVWATENTREALWDAMKRKETYATSGSRMVVRFFGGWDFAKEDATSRYLAETGYTKGVPMGSDLPKRADGRKAPTFLVAAMKDPMGANLDRIQIVKGWVDAKGKTHEKIFDVVWGDASRRKIGRNGKLAPVGDTVDVTRATWSNSIGDPDLTTVWIDPEFDAKQRAFYYARVIEIPTPRWTCYDAVRFGVKVSPEVPLKHQERAWSSPIWFTPQ